MHPPLFRTQAGNILFLILLTVALFAALAYAVTSTMRGGGKDASGEAAKAQAASIIQFLAAVDSGLLRMQMTGNLKTEQISFRYASKRANGNAMGGYQNNALCATPNCQLFHPEGGGIEFPGFEKYALKPDPTNTAIHPGYFVTYVIQWPGAGTEMNDVALQIFALSSAVCDALKQNLGITTAPVVSGDYLQAMPVSAWDSPGLTISSHGNQLIGKNTFVSNITTYYNQLGGCNLYHLLYAR